MGLNKSKGNMYDWITHTWNIIKGECPHDCSYCYCKRWGTQKPIRFDEKELKTDLGQNNFIFVGSSCDMFADDISERWIMETLNHCNKFDNTYLFQTKNPSRVLYFSEFPEKSVFCTTIESNCHFPEMGKAPLPIERSEAMMEIAKYSFTYVTIEPIMEFDLDEMINLIRMCNPAQVNIGFNSSSSIKLPEPSKKKTIELINELKTFTKVKIKTNSKRILNEDMWYI